MVSQIPDLARQIDIEKAIDPGFSMEPEETQRITSNTDEVVTIYPTSGVDMGRPRQILKNDARRVLLKRINGEPAFWMEGMAGSKPVPFSGTISCYMHPEFNEKDGPAGFDRAWLDSIGLAGRTCNMSDPSKNNKADFKSPYERDEHVRTKHRREWAIIQSSVEAKRRQDAIDDQRRATDAMIALAGNRAEPKK